MIEFTHGNTFHVHVKQREGRPIRITSSDPEVAYVLDDNTVLCPADFPPAVVGCALGLQGAPRLTHKVNGFGGNMYAIYEPDTPAYEPNPALPFGGANIDPQPLVVPETVEDGEMMVLGVGFVGDYAAATDPYVLPGWDLVMWDGADGGTLLGINEWSAGASLAVYTKRCSGDQGTTIGVEHYPGAPFPKGFNNDWNAQLRCYKGVTALGAHKYILSQIPAGDLPSPLGAPPGYVPPNEGNPCPVIDVVPPGAFQVQFWAVEWDIEHAHYSFLPGGHDGFISTHEATLPYILNPDTSLAGDSGFAPFKGPGYYIVIASQDFSAPNIVGGLTADPVPFADPPDLTRTATLTVTETSNGNSANAILRRHADPNGNEKPKRFRFDKAWGTGGVWIGMDDR